MPPTRVRNKKILSNSPEGAYSLITLSRTRVPPPSRITWRKKKKTVKNQRLCGLPVSVFHFLLKLHTCADLFPYVCA